VEAKMLAEPLEHCGAKQCFIVNPSFDMTEKQIEGLYTEIVSSSDFIMNKINPETAKKLS